MVLPWREVEIVCSGPFKELVMYLLHPSSVDRVPAASHQDVRIIHVGKHGYTHIVVQVELFKNGCSVEEEEKRGEGTSLWNTDVDPVLVSFKTRHVDECAAVGEKRPDRLNQPVRYASRCEDLQQLSPINMIVSATEIKAKNADLHLAHPAAIDGVEKMLHSKSCASSRGTVLGSRQEIVTDHKGFEAIGEDPFE